MQAVTATDLARHTREILDRVVGGGETVGVERNNTLIVKLVPVQRTVTAAQALAGLPVPRLSLEQANAWLRDSKQGFGDAVRDPWA